MTKSVYIIAEAGVNHNGERERAFALVDVAAQAGANAVKFQTFDAEKLAGNVTPKAAYQKHTAGDSESQRAMLKKLELPREWHCELQAHAKKRSIEFLSTAFDQGSLEFLAELNIPIFKIPSGELTNGPLLWQFARTGKPLIISTGMATLEEVEDALAVISHGLRHTKEPSHFDDVKKEWQKPDAKAVLKNHVTLLHCTSHYPAALEEINLCAMDTLAKTFGLPVGYSDHSLGTLVSVAAAARGAAVIEKHFTLDRNLPGPDHKASLTPDELTHMVVQIRELEKILGDGKKVPQPSELDTKKAARQQVIAARDISAGNTLSREDLTTARCGTGLSPHTLWELVGTRASKAYAAGEPILL
jgi:N-acetylneuraminate synthase